MYHNPCHVNRDVLSIRATLLKSLVAAIAFQRGEPSWMVSQSGRGRSVRFRVELFIGHAIEVPTPCPIIGSRGS